MMAQRDKKICGLLGWRDRACKPKARTMARFGRESRAFLFIGGLRAGLDNSDSFNQIKSVTSQSPAATDAKWNRDRHRANARDMEQESQR